MNKTLDNQPLERSAFIKAFPHLDFEEVPDAWGRPTFKHPHVQSLWDGWFARASLPRCGIRRCRWNTP